MTLAEFDFQWKLAKLQFITKYNKNPTEAILDCNTLNMLTTFGTNISYGNGPIRYKDIEIYHNGINTKSIISMATNTNTLTF